MAYEKIKREKGYLYYVGKDGYVWASPMKSNPNGKKHKCGSVFHERKGKMLYIDGEGVVKSQ